MIEVTNNPNWEDKLQEMIDNISLKSIIEGKRIQKEYDKVIIEGMLNVLKWIRNTDIGFNSLGKGTQLSIDDIIKKTEKYLNQ